MNYVVCNDESQLYVRTLDLNVNAMMTMNAEESGIANAKSDVRGLHSDDRGMRL